MLITWQVVQDAVNAYDAQKGLRRRLKKERAPLMTTIAALLQDRDLKTTMTNQERFEATIKIFEELGDGIRTSRKASAGQSRVLIDALFGGDQPFGAYDILYTLYKRKLLTFDVYEKMIRHPHDSASQMINLLRKYNLLNEANLLLCFSTNDLKKLSQIFISNPHIMQQPAINIFVPSKAPAELAELFSLLQQRGMLTKELAEGLAAVDSPVQTMKIAKKLIRFFPEKAANAALEAELKFLLNNHAKLFNDQTNPFWDILPRGAFTKESWKENWEAIKTKDIAGITAYLDDIALSNYCRPLFHEQIAKHFTEKFSKSTHGDQTEVIKAELKSLQDHIAEHGNITQDFYNQMKNGVYEAFSRYYAQHYPNHDTPELRGRIDQYCLSTKLEEDVIGRLNSYAKDHTPPEPPPSPKQATNNRKWLRMSRVGAK